MVARKRAIAHGAAVDLRVFENDRGIEAQNEELERENAEMRAVLEQIRRNDMGLAFH